MQEFLKIFFIILPNEKIYAYDKVFIINFQYNAFKISDVMKIANMP